MVLAYDLLEDRRTIGVIFTKFFPVSFENLDDILRDWAKNKVKKSLAEVHVREAGRRKIKPFLLENDSEKVLEQSQWAVERD